MFGQFSYLVYMLTFTLIPIITLWFINFRFLFKNIKVILGVAIIALGYQLIVDPFAEYFQAWFFSEDRILGIWLFNFPIENVLFFLLVSIALSSAVLTLVNLQQVKGLAKK